VSAKVFGQSVTGILTARPQLQTRIAQAKAITEALAELKGASMKFGQILSIQGQDFLPPEIAEILSKLQNSAPAFSGQEMFEIARAELGAKLDDLEFDLSSLAAASIGQVHRITLKNREAGVMKIQYPGIDKAITSEMAMMRRALGAVSKVYVGELAVDVLVDEIKNVLLQEVNYQLERQYMKRFGELLAGDPNLIVPTPFDEYSTGKVISMTYEKGMTLKELLAKNPSQEIRNQFGKILFELYLKEVYKFNFVQTDPNFANYLFRLDPQPQVVLLDFGATKTYSREMIESYKLFVLSIRDNKKDLFFELGDNLGFLKATESDETKKLFWEMCLLTLEPVAADGEFDFGKTDLPKRINQTAIQFLKGVRKTSPPKDVIFLNRKIGGIFNLLRSLGVRADYRAMVDEYLQPHS
jgi:predicted unusual protein kinase regulating ubiquinone biosynthesis (AarF/ABC1/UbiB family)